MSFSPESPWILCFLLKRGNVRVNLSGRMSSVPSAAQLLVRLALHAVEVGWLRYNATHTCAEK